MSRLLGALRLQPYTAAYGDEARFLMTAQGLRFHGRYALIGMVGQPPETQYPPGLPVLLAGVMWLTGTGQPLASAILPAKAAVLGLFLLSLWPLYDLLRRYGPRWVAVASVAAVGLHPLVAGFAAEPMSDVPFLSFCILSLWLLDKAGCVAEVQQAVPASSPLYPLWWAGLAGAAAGAAANFRLVGVVLVLCGLLYLALRRRWLAAVLFVGVAALLILPWHLHNQQLGGAQALDEGTVAAYVGAVTTLDPYAPAAVSATLVDLWTRTANNLRSYTFGQSYYLLHQPWRYLPGDALDRWAGKLDAGFGLLLAFLLMVGAAIGVRQRQWLLLLYCVVMQAVVILWPYPQQRYALPLLPFYFFYLFLALDWLASQVQPSSRRWANAGLAFFLAGSLGFLALVNLDAGLQAFRLRNAPDVTAFYQASSAEWANYFQAGAWLADHTPSDAVVVSRKPYLIYLYHNRPSLSLLWDLDPDAWMQYLREENADYIIEDAFTWSDATTRFLPPVLHTYPQAFQLVYATEPPVTRVAVANFQFVDDHVNVKDGTYDFAVLPTSYQHVHPSLTMGRHPGPDHHLIPRLCPAHLQRGLGGWSVAAP